MISHCFFFYGVVKWFKKLKPVGGEDCSGFQRFEFGFGRQENECEHVVYMSCVAVTSLIATTGRGIYGQERPN